MLIYVDYGINAIYAVDLLINFRTSFYNEDGEEVKSTLAIARRYLKSTLLFDIIVCIPWHELIVLNTDVLKILGVFKVTRIAHLSTIINRLDMKDVVKAYFAILIKVVYLVIYVHFTTCLWFYLISSDSTWVPPRD